MSSTADADDVIEVSADGLTVRKRFAADEFPVPAIRFEIESNHDKPVTFRLSEEIPESFPMDKVGFHPEYCSEDWTAFQDNHVEFTGTLEADESLVTVYGIRIDDESAASEFLTEPTVVEVSSEDETGSDADALDDDVIETIVSDEGDQAVKDMIVGEADSVPGLEDEALDLDLDGDDLEDEPDIELGFEEDELPDADDDDAIEAPAADEPVELELEDEESSDADDTEDSEADLSEIDLGLEAGTDEETVDGDPLEDEASTTGDDEERDDDPVVEESPADEEAANGSTARDDADVVDESSAEDGSDETTTESAVTLEEPIGARLATEIREGSVDEDHLDVLRDELDFGPSGSEVAKVEHLQSRVEEIVAYTDAIERFLDEEGTGEQLIEEFRTELSSFEDDLAAMDETVEATDERVDDVETDVESLTDWTADLEADLEDASDDIEALGDGIEDAHDDVKAVDERVDDLEDDLEAVQEGLTDIQDWRDQLGSMFADD
jgi:outer membrane murein-binding lipoprotein Lpp